MKVMSARLDKYETVADIFADWEQKSKSDAGNLLAEIVLFQFIVTFVTVYMYPSYFDGNTKKLQGTSTNLNALYNHNELIFSLFRIQS